MAGGENLQRSLQAIATFSEACLPEILASILYDDPDEKRLRRGGYGQLPDSFQAVVDGLVPGPKARSCGTCAYRAQRVMSEDVFTDPLWDDFHEVCRSNGIRSAWSSPLISPNDQSLLGVFGTEAQRQEEPLSLVFLDLDHFKLFNDNFSHQLGDKLLLQFSMQLKECLPTAQLLARFGGDEFVGIIPEAADPVSERLHDLLRRLEQNTLLIDRVRARLSFASGVVDLADVDWNISQAILPADTGTGQAKDSGRPPHPEVDAAQLSAVQRRRQVAKELEDAQRYGLVHPHAQPIVDLRTGAPLGMELLFRARTGVLRGACRLLKEPAIASSELVINVNLSVHQLLREDFPDEVAQLLAAEAVDAQRICLEITESRWLDPDWPSRLLLNRLVGQGFSLALDDFGNGYASLLLLRSVPFRQVKVDKTFVQELEVSEEALALCRAMLDMAKVYGIQVTAEGVETRQQRQILEELGYIRRQGYLFVQPTPLEETAPLLLQLQRQARSSAQD